MTTISAIITYRNRKAYLVSAINSIMNQSHRPNEIIIVDDNSEKPIEIEDLNLNSDTEIKIDIYYNNENKGSNYSRNLGARKAKSEIIMFLDDDDTWEPQKIEDQLLVFNDQNIGLVYTGKKIVISSDRSHVVRKSFPKKNGDLSKLIFTNNWIGSTSCVAVRKEIFDLSGGFDESLKSLQDYDLYLRICQITKIGHDNKCNLRYTVHSNPTNQITGQISRHIASTKMIYDKYSYQLNPQTKQKFRSFLMLCIGKSYISISPSVALKYIIRSFVINPEPRKLYYILTAFGRLFKRI